MDLKSLFQKNSLARRGLSGAVRSLLTLLYPPHCAACLADTVDGVLVCDACAAGAQRIQAPRCETCSQPFDGAITSAFVCSNCRGRRFHFTCAIAPYEAKGIVRDFIHKFKYEGKFHLRLPLAEWMAAGLEDERCRAHPFDGFVPVPLHPARERQREFNQAEVLAELVSRRAGPPVLHGLKRIRYTTTQTRLNRDERLENLRGAFAVRDQDAVRGRHLILVDDIFTTGSTVEECSRVLKAGGAASVRVLTVARA